MVAHCLRETSYLSKFRCLSARTRPYCRHEYDPSTTTTSKSRKSTTLRVLDRRNVRGYLDCRRERGPGQRPSHPSSFCTKVPIRTTGRPRPTSAAASLPQVFQDALRISATKAIQSSALCAANQTHRFPEKSAKTSRRRWPRRARPAVRLFVRGQELEAAEATHSLGRPAGGRCHRVRRIWTQPRVHYAAKGEQGTIRREKW